MKTFALPAIIALAIAAGSVAPSQAFELKSLFPGKGVLQEHKVDGTHGKRKRHGYEKQEGTVAYDGKLSYGGKQPLHIPYRDRPGGYTIWI